MNPFEQSVIKLINKHGITSKYISVAEGVYDIETSSVTLTETEYSVKIYMKHIRANQFNYPNLVGKDTGLFYIATSALPVKPEPRDRIEFNSKIYRVESVQTHAANGAIILYRILGVV